jgi:very-short-patch-repair endonuclease
MIERKVPRHHLSPILTDRAKGMRAGTAEAKLWYFLRKRRMNGFRFRQKCRVGPHLADFYCHQARVIILIGRVNSSLDEAGYHIVCVNSEDVHQNPIGVLGAILGRCCEGEKKLQLKMKN